MIDILPDRGAIRFLRVRDAGDVLNATFAFLRENARELVVSFFALVIPFLLIAGVANVVYINQTAGLAEPTDLGDLGAAFPFSYWVTMLAGLFGGAVAAAAVAGYVRLYREGAAGSITPTVLWEEARGLILPTLGLGFFTFLLVMGVGVAAAIAFIGLGSVLGSPVLGAFLYFVALVVAGAWLSTYASIIWATRMVEADTLGEAARRGGRLVRGSWWATFFSLLLPWVIAMMLLFGIVIMAGIATGGATLGTGSERVSVVLLTALTVPQQIIGYGIYLLTMSATLFVHGRLAAEMDGVDLEEDLSLLERGVEAAPASSWQDTPPASRPMPREEVHDEEAREDGAVDEGDSEPAPGGFRGGRFGS